MLGEIESAVEIVDDHIKKIMFSNISIIALDNVPVSTFQQNSPTSDMRIAFKNINTACFDLNSYLDRDIRKVLQIAEEFEMWDKQAGK